MTPEATPRKALYIETGLLDMETMIDIKRLNMMARLNREKLSLVTTVLANPGRPASRPARIKRESR